MTDKFLNKYRIPSARWQTWDYSADGLYFITINTAFRQCIFGRITDAEMKLSDIGKIVASEWEKSFEIRNELFCESFGIMPNHIHAILRIVQTDINVETHGVRLDDNVNVKTHGVRLNKTHTVRLYDGKINKSTGIAYRPPKSISSFVAGFKSSVSKQVNELLQKKQPSIWQTRFHDHVIRDYKEHRYIQHYIETNVEHWAKDKFYYESV